MAVRTPIPISQPLAPGLLAADYSPFSTEAGARSGMPHLPGFLNYNKLVGLVGSSPDKASTSGLQLVTDNPGLTSGLYWIKSASMPSALQMYVDTSQDGGGYDFYATKGSGPSVSYITDNHAGVALGLEMLEGRSRNCW